MFGDRWSFQPSLFLRVGRGRKSKNPQKGSKTTKKPRVDDKEQLKYDLAVLFSSKVLFNPGEWVTFGKLCIIFYHLLLQPFVLRLDTNTIPCGFDSLVSQNDCNVRFIVLNVSCLVFCSVPILFCCVVSVLRVILWRGMAWRIVLLYCVA